MTTEVSWRLVPVPGGLFDMIGGLDIDLDLDYLLSGDQHRFDEQAGFSLRSDVLVVTEERAIAT